MEATDVSLELGATHNSTHSSKWRPASKHAREPLAEVTTNVKALHIPLDQTPAPSDCEQSKVTDHKFLPKKKVPGGKIQPLECNNTPKPLSGMSMPTSIFDTHSKAFQLLTSRVKPGKAIQLAIKSDGKTIVMSTCSGEILCAASNLAKVCSTKFALSLSADNFSDQQYIVGSLQGNFLGSTFQFTNHIDPTWSTTIKFAGGCRIVPTEVRHMEVLTKDPADKNKNLRFVTEEPTYNSERKTYSMNMHGCAKVASVNNLKLKDAETGKSIFLLGKDSEHNYNILLWYPLSPLVAFSLALSCLCFKLITM